MWFARPWLSAVVAFSLAFAGAAIGAPPPTAKPSFAEPALSPDGREIAFVSGGDLWTVPVSGGEARLLVSHPAPESRPQYSPDGRFLAFVSQRTGGGDLYVLALDGGQLTRLTFDDGLEQLDGWSHDGRWLYFSTTGRDIAGMNDIYRVAASGGTPMAVSAERYTNEFFASPAPDGKTLALCARGIASAQWWRRGRSHIDESEIWLLRDGTYTPLLARGAKQLWPMWSSDGQALYFVSDRDGTQNLWVSTLDGRARALTRFSGGRVLWPSMATNGRTIAFERDQGIWTFDLESKRVAPVPITLRGAAAGPAIDHLKLTDQFREVALSPDGKKLALVARGEVFAASAGDGGDAVRLTTTAAEESQVQWSPDSRRLLYVSAREGEAGIYLYDVASGRESRLVATMATDSAPRFSPDGSRIAFVRNGQELRVLDLATGKDRRVVEARLGSPPRASERPFVWSPDGRWIAYLPVGNRLFKNVWVVPSAGGEARPLSFLANLRSETVSWSADGSYILFDSGQRTENGQVARIDLTPRPPRFREDQFRDLFREPARPTSPGAQASPAPPTAGAAVVAAAKPAAKSVEITFAEIRRRTSLLPLGVDVDYQAVSPDGKWLVVIASAAGQENLYLYSLDELSREPAVARQLTATPGAKGYAQFSPDSREIYFLERGRVRVVPVEAGRTARTLDLAAELDVDFHREKLEVFQQAWRLLDDNFYDPRFHGVDWQALRSAYAPYAAGARSPDELRRLLQLMVGELNASHLGASPPSGAAGDPVVGRLGVRFDRAVYEGSGRLQVSEVVPLGPAALAGIQPGDLLLAVEGRPLDRRANLDELLAYRVNRRVSLTVATAVGKPFREVVVKPVSANTEKGLLYRAWVEHNRALVDRLSGGRLGYVHMFDMSADSLARLHIDLDAENHGRTGVVVDLRNNNGGFVNAYALDVFSRRGYLTMTPRGLGAAPARSVLGQRALEAPTVLLVNQHTLSDGEDFTEGYRVLGLGRVVGEPTAGWIIYTSNLPLLDGTVFRVPSIRVATTDGSDMELHPRPVDRAVSRPLGEWLAGKDSQLEAAVRELMRPTTATKPVPRS